MTAAAGERVCAAGIYTAWTEPGAPGELHALAHLLCRDGAGAYAARFVHVTAEPWTGSAAAVAAALRDASGTGALADPALWRGAHGAVMAALRRALPALAFYEPLRFETDPATNLVTAATPVAGGGGEERGEGEKSAEEDGDDEDEAGPRAGIIHVDADVVVDRDAARAHATEAWLPHAQLRAMAGCAALSVEITTRRTSFARAYAEAGAPPLKRRGEMGDLFDVRETVLRPRGRRVAARVLVPRGFDCLVAHGVSNAALVALYRRWHAAAYGAGDATPPVFAFLGPELAREGADEDYYCALGFPLFATIKVAVAAPEAVRGALAAHRLTDGLWPALGFRAFHALGPVTCGLRLRCDVWPAGRVTSAVEHPCALRGAWLAKFDFAAFFPNLFLALCPGHARLRRAVRARAVKPALVAFFGGLKHTCPEAYHSVIALANGVSRAVEAAAAEAGLVTCAYVKDGFWGVLGGVPADAPEAAAAAAAERVRAACEAAAARHLADAGTAATDVTLRREGVFDAALAWSCHAYWLRRREGPADFVGFPARSGFGRAAKAALDALLREAVEGRADAGAARAACDGLVERAFASRHDPDFWAAPGDALAPAACAGATAGRGGARCSRRCVRLRGAGPVPYEQLRPPLILPWIDCLAHMEPVFAALVGMYNRALEALSDGDAPPPFVFTYTPDAFLFG